MTLLPVDSLAANLVAMFTGGFLFAPTTGLAFSAGGVFMLAGLIFCFGACLGSFANACAMRLVRSEDFVFTRSRCRGCDKSLGWRENLPVLGFALLRGRCGCGDVKLSWRYITVEVLGGCLLLSYAATLPLPLALGFGVALLFAGIACLTDLEALTLHPALLTALGTIGLSLAIAADFRLLLWHIGSAQALAGMVASAGLPLLVNAVYRLVRGRNGFGEGDFWLLAAIGAWLGPIMGPAVFLVACWLGAAVGLVMMMTGRGSIMTKLPFGLYAGFVFILWPNILTRVF